MTSVLPRRSAPPPPNVPPTSSGFADVSEMDKYRLVSNIGKGSFGVISKVQRIEDGKEFALKQLDYSKMTDKDRKQILAEVLRSTAYAGRAILEALKHRNIVQLIQKIKDPQNERIYIVMEYCTSGDLGSLIRKAQRSNQPLNEDKIWNIFLQITQALHHCHWPNERSQQQIAGKLGHATRAPANKAGVDADGQALRYQVLHRDLKPDNDDFVKLGDFGLSKDMGTAAFTNTYVGTPLYMPPEILGENKYDTKSDIWSLGCLVFEMCAWTSPFATAQTQQELIALVKSGRLPALPPQYSPALRQVIKSMLNLNPLKRPSTKDLLELEEMKLHRKLFTIQNQSSLLMSRKEELRKYEDSLVARAAMLDDRERAVMSREASIFSREESCAAREQEGLETQHRLNFAAETLRAQWEKLRNERAAAESLGQLPVLQEQPTSRIPSVSSSRPPLEERNTVPILPSSRFTRPPHPAYEDTPSKIPISTLLSPSLGLPRPSSQPQSLRRHASKSLGNIGLTARIQAEREAELIAMTAMMPMPIDSTPAKQVMGRAARNSIGSPNDAEKEVYTNSRTRGGIGMAGWSEDISMASPALSMASPWVPGGMPGGGTGRRLGRYSTAPPGTIHPSNSGSSQESMQSGDSAGSIAGISGEPLTYLQYDPAVGGAMSLGQGTPARWSLDDPELPSPFLRRMPTAPPVLYPSSATATNAGTQAGANTRDRAPLSSINPQPSASTSGASSAAANSAASIGIGKKAGTIPRSKSGNLHQHVLRSNAAAAQGDKRVGTAEGTGTGIRTRASSGRRET